MTLDEYAAMIDRIQGSTLEPTERRAALEHLAHEMDRCAWQPWARQRAAEVATQARVAADAYPDGGLAALNSLAGKAIRPAHEPHP